MKKIVVVIDALRSDKLRNIESLIDLKLINTEILPPFSFEPDAAYLAGKTPEDSNSGLKYWKADGHNPKLIYSLLSFLPSYFKKIRQLINLTLDKINLPELKRYKNNLGCIPFRLLQYFEISQELNLFTRNSGASFQNIFDEIEKDFFYCGTPFESGDLQNIKSILTNEVLDRHDTFFIYVSSLDRVGHKYGGNSMEYDKELSNILKFIDSKLKYFRESNVKCDLAIFGDHGMVNTKDFIDVERIIRQTNLRIGKDYIYFLDSTVARFWYFNEDAKTIIHEKLINLKGGSWLSKEEINYYNINYSHNKFGDDIWWANCGNLIHPNFWQGRSKIKGMHGYRHECDENRTILLSNFDHKIFNQTQRNMTDIYGFLCDFFEN